eukprot:2376376-Prymnesium_polylepis.1
MRLVESKRGAACGSQRRGETAAVSCWPPSHDLHGVVLMLVKPAIHARLTRSMEPLADGR